MRRVIDEVFAEKFNICGEHWKLLLNCVFEAIRVVEAELADIQRGNVKRFDRCRMCLRPFLSSFQDEFQVALKEIGIGQIQKVLWAAILMALYGEDDERVRHIFHRLL